MFAGLIPWDLLSDPSQRFNKLSSICNISPLTSSSKLTCLLNQFEGFLAVELSLQTLGGDFGC